MLPDFNRLRVFYHIYRRKSAAAAAKDLHVTQSAVSQHLQKLETEIKTRLFTRVHNRLVPTSAGVTLFGILEPFVRELENGMRHILEEKETPWGLSRQSMPVFWPRPVTLPDRKSPLTKSWKQ